MYITCMHMNIAIYVHTCHPHTKEYDEYQDTYACNLTPYNYILKNINVFAMLLHKKLIIINTAY